LVLSLAASSAVWNHHTEDFSTTQFKDPLNTTASWDTVAGEVGLLPFTLSNVGSYNTSGTAKAVVVDGHYAFVADKESGLQIIDISDPTGPSLVGTYDTPDWASDVAVAGHHAYVADYNSGLQVIDIYDPASPVLAGQFDMVGAGHGIAVSGDYAYVPWGAYGLRIIDIEDPTTPTLVATYSTSYCNDCAVAGDYAYVARGTNGVEVIDISDPTTPSSVGGYNTSGNSVEIKVSGDHAYVADNNGGLKVLDIENPATPTLAGSYATPGWANYVAVCGDVAYVTTLLPMEFLEIDISDPTSPRRIKSRTMPSNPEGVFIAGEHAFIADGVSGLIVTRVAEQVSPPLLAGSYDAPDGGSGVFVDGDYAYVAGRDGGLQIIDVSDPALPTAVGSYDTPGLALDVAVAGHYAYVANKDVNHSLQVIDIRDATNPTFAGSYTVGYYPYDVRLSGNYAYVANGTNGVRVIDITDPTTPTLASTIAGGGAVRGVDVSGDIACLAADTRIRIVSVKNPRNPRTIGDCPAPGQEFEVTIAGDYAYASCRTSGVQIIDLSDTTSFSVVGSYDTPGDSYEIVVRGQYAFVADQAGGMQVVDISDPTSPTLAGSFTTVGSLGGLDVSGDYVFAATTGLGLEVIQVFERGYDLQSNVAQSLAVDGLNDTIRRARFTATHTDSVRWELSADGGANWDEVVPGSGWHVFGTPGDDLLWRSTLAYVEHGNYPVCTGLEIDWLLDYPVIESITDVPNDQGKQVSVSWTRSGNDSIGSATPISEYAIFRRIDYGLSAAPGVLSTVTSDEDTQPPMAYPPGDWHFVTTVPADAEETYATVVPTLADSTIAGGMYYTVFFVRARTAIPGVYFESPIDSGYSVDNLAPTAPQNFVAVYNTGSGNSLSWDECPDEDFNYFNVYRSTDPGFTPGPANLVHSTTSQGWTDPEYDGWNVAYKISAVDFTGNESDATGPGSATGVTERELPRSFVLHQNVPNPFNPATTIAFDLPERASVRLAIYDVSGTLIRKLVDGEIAAGRKSVRWDGRDATGGEVASGVYFYRLETPTFGQSKKMILLR
jgi:hypothetical protein